MKEKEHRLHTNYVQKQQRTTTNITLAVPKMWSQKIWIPIEAEKVWVQANAWIKLIFKMHKYNEKKRNFKSNTFLCKPITFRFFLQILDYGQRYRKAFKNPNYYGPIYLPAVLQVQFQFSSYSIDIGNYKNSGFDNIN